MQCDSIQIYCAITTKESTIWSKICSAFLGRYGDKFVWALKQKSWFGVRYHIWSFFFILCEAKWLIWSRIFDLNQICSMIQGKFVKSKLKKSLPEAIFEVILFLSLAKYSIWNCNFVMYEAYFSCDLKRNSLSEIFYLSKIRGIYSVLRTSPHFLIHTNWKGIS